KVAIAPRLPKRLILAERDYGSDWKSVGQELRAGGEAQQQRLLHAVRAKNGGMINGFSGGDCNAHAAEVECDLEWCWTLFGLPEALSEGAGRGDGDDLAGAQFHNPD